MVQLHKCVTGNATGYVSRLSIPIRGNEIFVHFISLFFHWLILFLRSGVFQFPQKTSSRIPRKMGNGCVLVVYETKKKCVYILLKSKICVHDDRVYSLQHKF